MGNGIQLKTWVPKETKARFAAVARYQGLSESLMLKRLVDLMLQTAGAAERPTAPQHASGTKSRLTVRLPVDDQVLLRERAAARGIPPSTYLSVLTRAHLRNLTPLPKAEFLALKQTLRGLGDLARSLEEGGSIDRQGRRTALSREDAKAILRVCKGLRDHVRSLLVANVKSWGQGHAEPST
jgi:predicted DNA binding CopG/RHH family protein